MRFISQPAFVCKPRPEALTRTNLRPTLIRESRDVGLSALFVAMIAFWLRDSSDNQERTRHLLSDRLV